MDRLRLRRLLLSALTRELGALVIGLSDLTMLHSELTGLCPDLKVDDAALRFDGKLKFREVNIKSIVYINYIDWLPFNLVVGDKVVLIASVAFVIGNADTSIFIPCEIHLFKYVGSLDILGCGL